MTRFSSLRWHQLRGKTRRRASLRRRTQYPLTGHRVRSRSSAAIGHEVVQQHKQLSPSWRRTASLLNARTMGLLALAMPRSSCKTARAAASRERRREPRAAEAAENAASRPLMDRTGWVRGGDRSAGQPMQRSAWIRAARYIAESFWRSVIVAEVAASRAPSASTISISAALDEQADLGAASVGFRAAELSAALRCTGCFFLCARAGGVACGVACGVWRVACGVWRVSGP